MYQVKDAIGGHKNKYVGKILFSNFNLCKPSFVTTLEDYDKLTTDKRKKTYTKDHLHEVDARVQSTCSLIIGCFSFSNYFGYLRFPKEDYISILVSFVFTILMYVFFFFFWMITNIW